MPQLHLQLIIRTINCRLFHSPCFRLDTKDKTGFYRRGDLDNMAAHGLVLPISVLLL